MNIAAYEELRDFMFSVSPYIYSPVDDENTYTDYFDFLALLASNNELRPLHITLKTRNGAVKQNIYGLVSKDGVYYSTKIIEGTTNLLMFISSHFHDQQIDKNTVVIETIKERNSWFGLNFFATSVDSNSIFHGLALLHEYYGRQNDMRNIPRHLFEIQDVNVRYEKLELIRIDRVYGMVYQPGLHRIEITQFLSDIHRFLEAIYPSALELNEFSLKFPFTYGVGKHWMVLKFQREMVEFYASGPFVSRYATKSFIDRPAIDAMTKRMQDMNDGFLDINPETLTMVI